MYQYTYISEIDRIWGIPFGNCKILTLTNGQSAKNLGGGIVGLPVKKSPFVVGDTVSIGGSINYDGAYVLTGASDSEIRFAAVYFAETFSGTEGLAKLIGSLTSGAGRHCMDANANIYYGHMWNGTSLVTRIAPDGTQDQTFLTTSWPYIKFSGPMVTGICVDALYLYLLISQTSPGWGWVEKYELATGNLVWSTESTYAGYYMSIDANGNAYAEMAGFLKKFDSVTGIASKMANKSGTYQVCVDDDLGIVAGDLPKWVLDMWEPGYDTNLWVRTLDDSAGSSIKIGDNSAALGTGQIIIHDGYIWVLGYSVAGGYTINKVEWNGASLSIIDSVPGPPYQLGLFFDLWGNLVVVNQDWTVDQDDKFWYYDTDLNYLGKVVLPGSMLRTWDASTGGAWIQGDVSPFPDSGLLPAAEHMLVIGRHRGSWGLGGQRIACSRIIHK